MAFTIEDGCIKSLPHPNIDEDLFTKARYRDFEMEFDWKISPGGNSGVKYRIQDRVMLDDEKPGQKFEDRVNASMKNRRKDRPAKGQEYVIGFEYQVLDNEKNPDARRGTNHQAGALYDMLSPLEGRDQTGGRVQSLAPGGEGRCGRALAEWREGGGWQPECAGSGQGHGARDGVRIRRCTSCWSSIRRRTARSPYRITRSDAWFKNIKIRKL